jgi:hypothetical protein
MDHRGPRGDWGGHATCLGGLDTLLHGHAGYGVASFTAGEVRSLGWGVVRKPVAHLPGHAHVTGSKTKKKKPRQRLAKSCRMIRNPGPADANDPAKGA